MNDTPPRAEQWLNQQCPYQEFGKGVHLGLGQVQNALKALGLTSLPFQVITIAGTNGKGSTAYAVYRLLKEADLSVGLLTSPHLIRVHERIQIDDHFISDPELLQVLNEIKQIAPPHALSWFEYIFLAALLYFTQAKPQIVVLEVGLGGRLDAVNAVCPGVSVITTIGLDHCEILGHTLEEIALEKAAIMRPEKPAIIGKGAQIHTLLDYGRKINANMLLEGKAFQAQGCDPKSKARNLALAACDALKPMMWPIENHWEKLRHCKLDMPPGRMQSIQDKYHWVLDVSHNPQGTQCLADTLTRSKGQTVFALWSSVQGKDLASMCLPMATCVDKWFLAPLAHARGASLADLKAGLLKVAPEANWQGEATLEDALNSLEAMAQKNDKIVVFGSFLTVAFVLQYKLRRGQFKQVAWQRFGITAKD